MNENSAKVNEAMIKFESAKNAKQENITEALNELVFAMREYILQLWRETKNEEERNAIRLLFWNFKKLK